MVNFRLLTREKCRMLFQASLWELLSHTLFHDGYDDLLLQATRVTYEVSRLSHNPYLLFDL
jgi:hypothetical protein